MTTLRFRKKFASLLVITAFTALSLSSPVSADPPKHSARHPIRYGWKRAQELPGFQSGFLWGYSTSANVIMGYTPSGEFAPYAYRTLLESGMLRSFVTSARLALPHASNQTIYESLSSVVSSLNFEHQLVGVDPSTTTRLAERFVKLSDLINSSPSENGEYFKYGLILGLDAGVSALELSANSLLRSSSELPGPLKRNRIRILVEQTKNFADSILKIAEVLDYRPDVEKAPIEPVHFALRGLSTSLRALAHRHSAPVVGYPDQIEEIVSDYDRSLRPPFETLLEAWKNWAKATSVHAQTWEERALDWEKERKIKIPEIYEKKQEVDKIPIPSNLRFPSYSSPCIGLF